METSHSISKERKLVQKVLSPASWLLIPHTVFLLKPVHLGDLENEAPTGVFLLLSPFPVVLYVSQDLSKAESSLSFQLDFDPKLFSPLALSSIFF